jgi:CTP synthase
LFIWQEYQNAIFIEAARILKLRNPDDVMFVMVSYLPIPGKLGEMKTKPTQNAIRTLNSYGVHPDIIIARSEVPLDVKRKQKIAESNGVRPENVISAPDVESIYDVPVNFEKDGLSKTILDFFKLREKQTDLVDWRKMLVKHKRARGKVKIAVVGKYFKTGDFVLSDAYISVLEALKHSATYFEKKCEIAWLNSEVYEKNPAKLKELSDYDGILVPGGFGTRGVEGLIKTIEYARKNKIPYFGLCYGMQLAVIEYARNVVGVKGATTREIDPKAKNLVVDIMPEQIKNLENGAYGGTMRLGSYKAFLKKGSVAAKAYGTVSINERHRHRFEINPAYIERVESAGLVFSGRSPNGMLMEIAELPQKVHPFFVAVQFHPEFKSTPLNPHPLFREFIKAATTKKKK